jgi:hypothetical protein
MTAGIQYRWIAEKVTPKAAPAAAPSRLEDRAAARRSGTRANHARNERSMRGRDAAVRAPESAPAADARESEAIE